MEISYDGRVVVVTGGGRGLGRAYALLLGGLGAQVVVSDAGVDLEGEGFDPAPAQAVAAEIEAAGGTAAAEALDLAERDACHELAARALARFGRIDALIHSAGIVDRHHLEELSVAAWDHIRRINIDAAVWLCQAVLPPMRRAGYGRIVLTVSGHGLFPDEDANLPAYAVTKAAQFGLMNSLAGTYRRDGILVNAIAPVAATRIWTGGPGANLEPERVAPGVAYLASEACETTGVVLRAARGTFSIGLYGGGPTIELGPGDGPGTIADRWRAIAVPALAPASELPLGER